MPLTFLTSRSYGRVVRCALAIPIVALLLVPAATGGPERPLRVLFASARTGTLQIYSVDSSGHNLRQLTFGSRDSCSPRPSPNGRYVLFFRSTPKTSCSELWVGGADGRGARRLAPLSFDADWSPDSRRIAYETGGRGIAEVRRDGSRRRSLTTEPGDRLPRWSRDGKKLLVTRGSTLVVVQGRKVKVVADNIDGAGTWSPDGRSIAFVSRAPSSPATLDVVRADGTGRRTLAQLSFGSRPTWSPTRPLVALNGDGAVNVVNVETGKIRRLPFTAHWLAWAPHGDALAAGAFGTVVRLALDGKRETLFQSADGDLINGVAWTTPAAGARYRRPQALQPLSQASQDELRSRYEIADLTADGGRVLFRICDRVQAVWHPSQRAIAPLGDHGPTACRIVGSGRGFAYDLALAGNRAAYIVKEGGIGVLWSLWLANVGRPTWGSVLQSGGRCCSGHPLLPPIGYVEGQGSLLVFSSWNDCGTECVGEGDEVEWASPAARPRILSQAIWRIREPSYAGTCVDRPGPCQQIASVRGAYEPLAVDSSRILVRRGFASLDVLDENGAVLRSLPFTRGAVLAADLSGNDVVVLVAGQVREYDVRDGSLVHAWSMPDVSSGGACGRLHCYPAGPVRLRFVGAAAGVAAFTLDGQLHVLRLSDGNDSIIGEATAASVDESGLFYAYKGADPWPGRIRFVPRARLLR
jgi:hypothetical protein